MSDPNRDPIRDLESFGTGGLIVNPLAPEQVRHLGDQHRARRRASMLVAAAAVAVVVAIVPVSLLVAKNDSAPTPPPTTHSPTPTPTESPTLPAIGLGNIPANFPLDVDANDYSGDGGEMHGPGPEVETGTPSLCHHDAIATADARGRLGFSSTGPETVESRELRTFKNETAATAVMTALQKDLDDCSTWVSDATMPDGTVPELKVTRIAADTGQRSVTFAVTELAPGYAVGGTVYQVTRVGSAILTLADGGEYTADTAPLAGPELVGITRKIAPEMCEFTTDACTPPTADAPQTITYPGTYDSDGVVIATDDDLDLLRGAPDSFKEFIRDLITVEVDGSSCGEPTASHQVADVQKISTAGYALGNVFGCPDEEAVWALRNGSWTTVLGGTDALSCQDLDREGVPRMFIGACYNTETDRTERSGDFGPLTVDSIRLGMTADEVRALGGTVPAGSGCRVISLPGTTPHPDQGDGWISEKGVVAISAGETSQRITPEGISPGSTRREVEAAYPQGFWEQHGQGGGYYIVPLAGDARYRFALGDEPTSVVSSIGLSLESQNCFE